MKNYQILIFSLLLIIACSKKQPTDYVTLSGKIENNKDSLIRIMGREGLVKEIKLDKDGNFKDTLKISQAAIYGFTTESNKNVPVFLKNGFDITIKGDYSDFFETFKFSGEGSQNSNFIIAQIKQSRDLGNPQEILDLQNDPFRKKIDYLKSTYDSILNSYRNLDSTLYANIKLQNEQIITYFENTYEKNKILGAGKPSPKFENYTDFKGGLKSLSSFKGKYVYIDVWATWCGPCIQQIPFLKEMKQLYKNKNIVFLGISSDEPTKSGGSWETAEKKWRDFVKEYSLVDVQLWAGKDFNFQQDYQINGIPRFILIDPNGNIVDSDAPRPSDPSLRDLLDAIL